MKRFLSVFVSGAVLLSVVSCGKVKDDVVMATEIQPPVATQTAEPVATERPSKVDEVIINNGGWVVGYSNKAYLHLENEDESYDIYSMDNDSDEITRLTNKNFSNMFDLYILDGNMYFDCYIGGNREIYKLNLENNDVEKIGEGVIRGIDEERKELYYIDSGYPDESKKGIYRMSAESGEIVRITDGPNDYLGRDGDVIYLEKNVDKDKIILSSVKRDGTDLKDIVVIKPNEFFKGINDDIIYAEEYNHIYDFGTFGDKIYLSIGSYQGSGGYFYGGMISLDKDGQNIQNFHNSTSDEFDIVDGYIYYENFDEKTDSFGSSRVNLSTDEEQFLGTEVNDILAIVDNKLYYEMFDTEVDTITISSLKVMDLDTLKTNTLVDGQEGMLAEDSYYLGYGSVQIIGDDMFYTVYVEGYREGDSWRGHICYEQSIKIDMVSGEEYKFEENPEVYCVELGN